VSTRTAICPVDFSDHSRQALRYASALAAYVDGRLVVAHVVDPLLAAAQRTYQWDPLGADTREELEGFVWPETDAEELPRSGVELVLRQGEAAAEIVGLAKARGAELIVMGTHGLSGFRRMFFGSTTARVLRATDIPVLAVPLGDEAAQARGPRRLVGALVAPVDFSDSSLRAADMAVRIAKALGQPLVLLHVVSPLRAAARWQPDASAHDEVRVEKARNELARIVVGLGATDVERLVSTGDPAEEIARVASERRAGVIVMGLQGHGLPLVGRAPGSVATRVLALAPVPVLCVPGTPA
jgi:nucleotide-binding universal stress UspA family protein